MKIINAKVLIFIMFINMLLPLSAFAEDTITLYNHDEEVYLTNDIETYNNHYYISVEDLHELELDWKLSDSLYIESYYNDLIIYPETSIIELNGNNLLFQNPMKDIGGIKYVSLDLIAMVFSGMYEITDNSIYLWINTDQAYTARGTISLPNDEVAPVGGIEILVFYGRKQSKSQGSGSNYSEDIGGLEIGYRGVQKPSGANNESQYSIYKYAEKYVTIPEGKNSVEYALGISHMYFGGCLGYEVDTDTYKENYMEEFYKNPGIVNFEIYSNTVTLSGIVSLPEIVEKDVKFTVYSEVYGEKIYSYDGIISAGTDFAPYSMQVGKYDDYSMSVVFADNEYKRIFNEETITVKDTEVSDIDFETEKSNIVSGMLKLPDNMVFEEDIEATVTIQSGKAPYYYLDSENVVITAGNTSEEFTLFDDMGCGSVICYYELQSDNDELFTFGHYSETGTTVINDYASRLRFSDSDNQSIEIPMLKNKSTEVKICLPDGYVAKSNIYGNIYLTTAYERIVKDSNMAVVGEIGTTSGGGLIVAPGTAPEPSIPLPATPLLKKGEREAIKTFKVPDDAEFKYNIVLDGIDDSNDTFYDMTYYKGDGETTVFRERAKELTSSDNNIELTLMKQHKLKGKIATDVICDAGMVYAIYQADSEMKADVKNTAFKVVTEPDIHNNFKIFVPDELDDYIFRFDIYGKTVYYSSTGIADNIDDAEVVEINSDTNIEILYEGYKPKKPLVINYHDIDSDIYGWNTTIFDGYIQLKNISDYKFGGEDLHIASYDADGRLLHIETLPTLIINPHDYGRKYKLTNYIDKNVAYVKIFAWSEGLKPRANSCKISSIEEDEAPGDATVDYTNVFCWMQAGNTEMYHNGRKFLSDVAPCIENDTLYVPTRVVAEIFGVDVTYDSATQTILIYLNDKEIKISMNSDIAVVNGEEYRLRGKPIIINSRTMIPIMDLAEILGFNSKYISKTGEFVIYGRGEYIYKDVLTSHLYADAITMMSGLGIMNGYEDGTFKPEATVDRAELSKLICNVAEADASTIVFSCGDVDANHWAVKFVGYCVLNNIIALEDGLYRPENVATVIETISAILNLKGFDGNGTTEEILGVAEECGLLNKLSDYTPEAEVTRGEMAQLLCNSLEIDCETSSQEKFLELCNSGKYEGILDAMQSGLYEYSLYASICSLNWKDRVDIAKRVYSHCSYFDSIDTFNKWIEVGYAEWKKNKKPTSSGGGSASGGGSD